MRVVGVAATAMYREINEAPRNFFYLPLAQHFLPEAGLYGLTAITVAQRTREIAIRIALGSSQEGVLSVVLRQAGGLPLIGAVIGITLAAGCSFLLGRLLIGLAPIDPRDLRDGRARPDGRARRRVDRHARK